MRRLKAWSGLTYRQLEYRAASVGDVLPHSTLLDALHRGRLPREEVLTAFVRACGSSTEAIQEWVAARKRLAVTAIPGRANPSTPPNATVPPTPAKPAPPPARRWLTGRLGPSLFRRGVYRGHME